MSGVYLALSQESTRVDAFDWVFEAYYADVYGLAHALLRNAQDAEDVTQDVFLRVYKALPSYEPDRASLRTWLARIVVNACQIHRRRNFLRNFWGRARARDDEALSDVQTPESVEPTLWGAPEEYVLQAEMRQTIRDVLAKLRFEHRAAVILHYYRGLSCQEIARIFGCPEGTVRSRLHYARRMVKVYLEQHALRSTNEEEL